MTTRERCMNILHYKDIDRMPAVHFGYWRELLAEWADQGHITHEMAKAAVRDNSPEQRELDKIIGWDCNWYNTVGTNNGLSPRFKREVLETLPDGSQRVLTANGVIERIKPGIVSIPSEDDYLLKDREAFETLFKPKMEFSPERVNVEFFKKFNETRETEYPIGLHVGSVMGHIRDMTTVMGMSYLIYDEDEELFADIVDTYAEMQYNCVEAVLETGVNVLFPIEIGTWGDQFEPARKKYGKEILGVGGMDKTAFRKDKSAVDAEIERMKRLFDMGGFIPCPDHRLMPGSKIELVQYYAEEIKKIRV